MKKAWLFPHTSSKHSQAACEILLSLLVFWNIIGLDTDDPVKDNDETSCGELSDT